MSGDVGGSGRLPDAFRVPGSSSFSDFVGRVAPELLPGRRPLPVGASLESPHGTTIVSLEYAGGVVMAGDRRATMGNLIANRDMEKVFAADEYAVVGIAGTAGLAIELVRLYQVELEHYEKIEGATLSLDGKANRLATMIRGNLGMAMQGLAVVPMFAGFDLRSSRGRIYSYDITGGRYEEAAGYHAVGSGSLFAKSALKKRFREGLPSADAVRLAVEALYDAADDDSATGGPDVARGIYPVVGVVSAVGVVMLSEAEVGEVARAVVDDRLANPGG